jgi:hypothetical protein
LASENRPDEVRDWFQHGRKWGAMPDISADIIARYEKQWWLWWTGLQPSWRGTNPSALTRKVPRGYNDWSAIRKGGQNGIFVVILTLGWWLVGARNNDGRGIAKCEEALDDLVWVLDNINSHADSLKRTHGEADKDIGSKKKKYVFITDANNLPKDIANNHYARGKRF